MFFLSNITGVRSPYRVEAIEKDRKEERSFQDSFQDEDSEETRKKFELANHKLKEKKTAILASQMMNQEIVALEATLSVKQAFEKIRLTKIEYFPIVTKEERFMGLLSEKVILRELEKGSHTTLEELLSREILCADPETDLQEIISVFRKEEVEAIPILDKQHRAIGIVSRNDLLRTMLKITQVSFLN